MAKGTILEDAENSL